VFKTYLAASGKHFYEMDVYKIVVHVGIGQPCNGELIFNFHFITFIGLEWTSSFSYGQLCQIDNYVNFACRKIKHVAFPVTSTSRQQRIIQLIGTDHSYSRSLVASKRMIEKLRSMFETWVSVLLMRLHAMPVSVQEKIEGFFSLPNGPHPPDYLGPESILAAEAKQSLHNSKSREDTYEKVIRLEEGAESSKTMLSFSVIRGPEGPRRQQEYQVREKFSLLHNAG
jgi:hypothetical protein